MTGHRWHLGRATLGDSSAGRARCDGDGCDTRPRGSPQPALATTPAEFPPPPPPTRCILQTLLPLREAERGNTGTLEYWKYLPASAGNQRPRCWDPCTAQLSLGKCQCGNVGHPLSSETLCGSSTQLKQARPDGLLAITELGANTHLVPAPRLQEWVHLRMFHTHSLATGRERLDLFGNAAL